jgi:HAD superfamily hydrolase (TIGR01549 family)
MVNCNKKQIIKVISFDLDNTLYDNRPVIDSAEKESRDFLELEFKKQGQLFDSEIFLKNRNELLRLKNSKYEDFSLLRKEVLIKSCAHLKKSEWIVEEAFQRFIQARQQVIVPQAIQEMLIALSKCFKLVTITNGNCNAEALSISQYFDQYYSPQKNYRAKPHPNMLEQTIKDFAINKNELLHVGDELKTDGKAAENVGCQFHYFTPFVEANALQASIQLLLEKLIPTKNQY